MFALRYSLLCPCTPGASTAGGLACCQQKLIVQALRGTLIVLRKACTCCGGFPSDIVQLAQFMSLVGAAVVAHHQTALIQHVLVLAVCLLQLVLAYKG